MISDHLLDIARRLAEGNPTQADLRRAASSVYYAVFHAICQSNADTLVGDDPQDRDQLAWRQAYRALEHGYAKQRCERARREARFAVEIQILADYFPAIQHLRHQADYDPDKIFVQQEILSTISESTARINIFRSGSSRERRAFGVYVLMRDRQD